MAVPADSREESAVRRLLRGRDLAVGYAAVVATVSLVLLALPDATAQWVVQRSSTNLVNLRLHPPFVLVASAFMEPGLLEMMLVVPLVWALGALQRRLGRAAVVVTAALGHVGSTLGVSTVLLAGITHGRIALTDVETADVGVSYVLVTALGLLTAWAPPGRRGRFVAGGTAVLLGALLLGRTFTDLGHLLAWSIGLGLAVLVDRARTSVTAHLG